MLTDPTLLTVIVETSLAVAATPSRTAKIARLAQTLGQLRPNEVVPAVGFLVGKLRQGRVGIGWATVSGLTAATTPSSALAPTLTITDLDILIDTIAATTGEGSVGARNELLARFARRATAPELAFVSSLLVGELRQGANEGIMADAIAKAASVPAPSVRRAHLLAGDLPRVAAIALASGASGLDAVGLEVGRGLQPMLAATAASVADALAEVGRASVEYKLDGARIQVHRDGGTVRIFTRNLNDVTERLPEVVALVQALPLQRVVLDGELLGVTDADAPELFQDTMSRFGTHHAPAAPGALSLRPWFFDCLHLDGRDLIDEPLETRLAALSGAVGELRIPGIVTADSNEATAFATRALAAGHEGVVVKSLDSTYLAGRRGKAWRKVKPVHTLDLVVLGAEWGHGRRRGWLSNLHLGARAGSGEDAFVMVGKTFKGLTDALLTWQTDALLQRQTATQDITVLVRPELVVEIALDGVQRSTRYPGGVALRFARVVRYRPDKDVSDADTIETVQSLLSAGVRSDGPA